MNVDPFVALGLVAAATIMVLFAMFGEEHLFWAAIALLVITVLVGIATRNME